MAVLEKLIVADEVNSKRASRKTDREFIAAALLRIAGKHGATVEWKDVSATLGYCGAGIDLHFILNSVGALVCIDNLHGGEHSLISWHNTEYPPRKFTTRFCVCIGDLDGLRPHHKATSCPADWYSLAMQLDAGLCLAARNEAFIPSEA